MDSKGEVCMDPGEKGAVLEAGGPSLPGEGKDWQLASDSRREETKQDGQGRRRRARHIFKRQLCTE